MLCPKCGKELSENAVFCINCGTNLAANAPQTEQEFAQQQDTQLADPAQNQSPANNSPQSNVVSNAIAKLPFDVNALLKNKLVWLGVGAAAVVIIAIIIIANAAASAGNTSLKGTAVGTPYKIFSVSDETYFYKGDKEIAKIESRVYNRAESAYRNAYAITDSDDTLYLLYNDKLTTVDSDVRSVYISDDGSTLVYTNSDNALWYFKDNSKKKITDIDSDSSYKSYNWGSVAISPNGDTVAYYIREDDKNKAFVFDGSKNESLGTKLKPISVCNGGSVIFAENDNGKLGYIKNKKGDDFVSVKSYDGSFKFSEDKKSLIFMSGSSTYYFEASMKDPIKICSGSVSLVLPQNTTGTVKSFGNFLGVNDGKIYRFYRKGDDFEKIKLVSNINNQYQVSADGNSIFYLKNDKLYRVDTKTGEKNDVFAEIDDGDVDGFIALPDFSGFYLIEYNRSNYLSSIYYVGKNGGEVKKSFAEDVYVATVDDSGTFVYITDYSNGSGSLYYSKKGDKGKKVNGLNESSNVESDSTYSTVFAYDDDGILYVSANGIDFKKTRIER